MDQRSRIRQSRRSKGRSWYQLLGLVERRGWGHKLEQSDNAGEQINTHLLLLNDTLPKPSLVQAYKLHFTTLGPQTGRG